MNELQHHGIKGQKWGVRRYQHTDGTLTNAGKKRYADNDGNGDIKSESSKIDNQDADFYLKKGSVVKRIATDDQDRTHNNRKYVSINEEDHNTWDDYLGRLYLKKGYLTVSHTYTTVKDIKVMSSTKQGELYTKMLMNSDFKKQAVKDLEMYYKYMPQVKRTNDKSIEISRLMSAATLETGKRFSDEVMKRGYDAVVDTHGQNTAKTPVIILNADTKLKHINVDYSETSKEYLKNVYGISA